MVKFTATFITALLGAIVMCSAVQADSFSNEDAACTGTCQVHDSARPDKTLASGKEPVRVASTPRHTKREAPQARRVTGAQLVKLESR